MIARCDDCGRAYLEIDSRKLADPEPLCAHCALDGIERGEAERLADAGDELACIASAPASWGAALLRMAKR